MALPVLFPLPSVYSTGVPSHRGRIHSVASMQAGLDGHRHHRQLTSPPPNQPLGADLVRYRQFCRFFAVLPRSLHKRQPPVHALRGLGAVDHVRPVLGINSSLHPRCYDGPYGRQGEVHGLPSHHCLSVVDKLVKYAVSVSA